MVKNNKKYIIGYSNKSNNPIGEMSGLEAQVLKGSTGTMDEICPYPFKEENKNIQWYTRRYFLARRDFLSEAETERLIKYFADNFNKEIEFSIVNSF